MFTQQGIISYKYSKKSRRVYQKIGNYFPFLRHTCNNVSNIIEPWRAYAAAALLKVVAYARCYDDGALVILGTLSHPLCLCVHVPMVAELVARAETEV